MSKVGFIGLGIMGRPMATNLVKAGQDLMVSDLNETLVKELCDMGASSGSYADIARECDLIITILPTGAIVREVLFGENGVASALTGRQGGVRHVQRHPGESQECYRRLKEIGVGFVDAPVSGRQTRRHRQALWPLCAAAIRRTSTGSSLCSILWAAVPC